MKDYSQQFTDISDLGEFGLIEHLLKNIGLRNESSVKGPGDDAGVIDFKDKLAVVTSDILLEGVHFDLTYTPLKHLGYKAVVVNLSDIYAMNAIPGQIIVSIGMSRKFSVEMVEDIYEGIRIACDAYGVDLIGGDTTSSLTGLALNVTALGSGEKSKLVYRDGAAENDLICVSGDLGAAYMGLQVLEREKRVFMDNPDIQPELEGFDYLLERQLKPEARKDIVEMLDRIGVIPTSMIDISDGLASELFHICKSSGTGCNIYENKLPIDQETFNVANDMSMVPVTCALSGGEDYELLFTVSQKDYEKVKGQKDISVIGHITSQREGLKLTTNSGQSLDMKAQGWDSFK